MVGCIPEVLMLLLCGDGAELIWFLGIIYLDKSLNDQWLMFCGAVFIIINVSF